MVTQCQTKMKATCFCCVTPPPPGGAATSDPTLVGGSCPASSFTFLSFSMTGCSTQQEIGKPQSWEQGQLLPTLGLPLQSGAVMNTARKKKRRGCPASPWTLSSPPPFVWSPFVWPHTWFMIQIQLFADIMSRPHLTQREEKSWKLIGPSSLKRTQSFYLIPTTTSGDGKELSVENNSKETGSENIDPSISITGVVRREKDEDWNPDLSFFKVTFIYFSNFSNSFLFLTKSSQLRWISHRNKKQSTRNTQWYCDSDVMDRWELHLWAQHHV